VRKRITMKKYKVNPPIGSIVVSKQEMTEEELRHFLLQLVQEAEQYEIWKEKSEKDSIEEIVDFFNRSGFIIEEL